jgi:zinc protease
VLDEVRRQSLAAWEQQRKEPEAIVANALARHGNPYPRGDPRHARTFDEAIEDVRAVSVERLREFRQRFVGAGRAEFAAVGDFDAAAVRASLATTFAGWRAPVTAVRIAQPLWTAPPARLVFATPDKQNATMWVRLPVALSDRDPDYPALMVANHILGGGGDSRLWARVREQGGLSYDVGSWIQWSSREPASLWQASAIFAPANRGKVEAAFAEEVARARKEGFGAGEVQRATQGLLSARRLARAQDASLAAVLAANLDLGRTMAVSAAVDAALAGMTVDQVDAALRRHIRPDAFVVGFGGNFDD